MKLKHATKRGFTMVDLIVCLASIVALSWLATEWSKPKRNFSIPACRSNLRQVFAGFALYAGDSNDRFPPYLESKEAWEYLQIVGLEIGSPRVLVCPVDLKKGPAQDFETNGAATSFSFSTNRNNALSYFYGAAKKDNPDSVLTGDRNVTVRSEVVPGVLLLGNKSPIKWSSNIHTNVGHVALSDGSVYFVPSNKLKELLPRSNDEITRWILP